jgi:hypothetical protein
MEVRQTPKSKKKEKTQNIKKMKEKRKNFKKKEFVSLSHV